MIYFVSILLMVELSAQEPDTTAAALDPYVKKEACKVLEETSRLFPRGFSNLYLGMQESELRKKRPNIKVEIDYRLLGKQNDRFAILPALYGEQLHNSPWENGIYGIFKSRLTRVQFVAFAQVGELRRELLERYLTQFGPPNNSRVTSVVDGALLEWIRPDVTVILFSQSFPPMAGKGTTTSLGLIIKATGFEDVLKASGPLSAENLKEEEVKTAKARFFPELEGLLVSAQQESDQRLIERRNTYIIVIVGVILAITAVLLYIKRRQLSSASKRRL